MNRGGTENPLALGLVILGAIAMAVATFLPFAEPVGVFGTVRSNTLIQHGGWLLIALAIAIAASGYGVSQRKGSAWGPIILCIIAAAGILVVANDKGMRTLYSISPDGTPDTSHPGTLASLGVAIYVAGAGVGAALIGSLMLRQSDAADAPAFANATTKKCPDCAETVLADARVCKHCRYRFALAADGKARSNPTSHARQPPPKAHAAPEAESPPLPTGKTKALRIGDRVTLVAPGDKNDGKTGKVTQLMETGYVVLRFAGFSPSQYLWDPPVYAPHQLKRVNAPTN